MYAASRALKPAHTVRSTGVREPVNLNEVAFKRRRKKEKIKRRPPTHATTYFLKSYYNRNKEVSLIKPSPVSEIVVTTSF